MSAFRPEPDLATRSAKRPLSFWRGERRSETQSHSSVMRQCCRTDSCGRNVLLAANVNPRNLSSLGAVAHQHILGLLVMVKHHEQQFFGNLSPPRTSHYVVASNRAQKGGLDGFAALGASLCSAESIAHRMRGLLKLINLQVVGAQGQPPGISSESGRLLPLVARPFAAEVPGQPSQFRVRSPRK
jgi:hypothetical protein